MSKKASTINLEESTWEEIQDYMDKYKLKNRNEAIERMFVERRVLLRSDIVFKNKEDKVEVDEDKLSGAIASAMEDMPE